MMNIVNFDNYLPNFIFEKKFQTYLFFDADVCSSLEFVGLLKEILERNVSCEDFFTVFSYSEKMKLGCVDFSDDWALQIDEIVKTIRGNGDHGGLYFSGGNASWCLVQATPVDVGVLAFGEVGELPKIPPNVSDGFFGCNDILNWIDSNDLRAQAMRENLGADFLKSILKNYCT